MEDDSLLAIDDGILVKETQLQDDSLPIIFTKRIVNHLSFSSRNASETETIRINNNNDNTYIAT